jgi:hypothetical protein
MSTPATAKVIALGKAMIKQMPIGKMNTHRNVIALEFSSKADYAQALTKRVLYFPESSTRHFMSRGEVYNRLYEYHNETCEGQVATSGETLVLPCNCELAQLLGELYAAGWADD